MRDAKLISIHALREEGDRWPSSGRWSSTQFLSTPSARRATLKPVCSPGRVLFLSTPSARRATSWSRGHPLWCGISIHALREEGDQQWRTVALATGEISIHALREEGDIPKCGTLGGEREFLSTPSARRATVDGPISVQLVEFLSTPSARRATLHPGGRCRSCGYFYPRPPRGGRPKRAFS